MLRRKLTAYTVMYIAGIAAGYFMLIEIRPVEGTCFMIACALAVLFSDMAEIEKRALILFLLMGFMLFVIHFAFGGSPSDETYTEDAPVEENILFDAREGFIDNFDEDTGAFIKGVVFGDKADIDDSLKAEFNGNQTGHILAVSGLHVGFLYSLLRLLTGRKRTKITSAFIIAVLLLYGTMTMWSTPTVRACIVMSVSLLAIHFKRKADLLTDVHADDGFYSDTDEAHLDEAGEDSWHDGCSTGGSSTDNSLHVLQGKSAFASYKCANSIACLGPCAYMHSASNDPIRLWHGACTRNKAR